MDDLNVIVSHMLPLQRENLTRPHAGEQGELHDQLSASIEDVQHGLHIVRRQHAA